MTTPTLLFSPPPPPKVPFTILPKNPPHADSTMAERILMNEYKSLVHEDWVNIDLHEEDIFKWDIAVIVLNPESLYYGGYLRASMAFPKNYPYAPPGMSDISPTSGIRISSV